MVELKTRKTDASVTDFLQGLENEQRRRDGFALLDVFTRVTKMPPRLWGSSIVGFGQYHYKSARSSAQGDWPLTGFSPRKRNMTVYIMPGFSDYQELLAALGKHRTSVSCLYFTRLDNIDIATLQKLIRRSVADMKKRYPWNNGSAA